MDNHLAKIEQLEARIAELEKEIKNNEENLTRFDAVDFEGWNKKNMDVFNELHHDDVVIYYPGGVVEEGLELHAGWAKKAFDTGENFAIVKSHPIQVASNNWTAVIGINEIPQEDGTIKEVPMATFSKWKDGAMTEEHLFFG